MLKKGFGNRVRDFGEKGERERESGVSSSVHDGMTWWEEVHFHFHCIVLKVHVLSSVRACGEDRVVVSTLTCFFYMLFAWHLCDT